MFDEFKVWVEGVLGNSYRYFQGNWIEDPGTHGDYFCSIRSSGSAPTADKRVVQLDLILAGPRNERGAAARVRVDAERLMAFATAEDRLVPCGAANLRALREPVGPGYTSENRAWYSLTFEVIF